MDNSQHGLLILQIWPVWWTMMWVISHYRLLNYGVYGSTCHVKNENGWGQGSDDRESRKERRDWETEEQHNYANAVN